jgi:hypothetical protein
MLAWPQTNPAPHFDVETFLATAGASRSLIRFAGKTFYAPAHAHRSVPAHHLILYVSGV